MKDATPQGYRTSQVWSILVLAAQHQKIITYATIQKLTGLPRNGLGSYLDLIGAYCNQKEYPELWSIAVNEETGFPGTGGMEGRWVWGWPESPCRAKTAPRDS